MLLNYRSPLLQFLKYLVHLFFELTLRNRNVFFFSISVVQISACHHNINSTRSALNLLGWTGPAKSARRLDINICCVRCSNCAYFFTRQAAGSASHRDDDLRPPREAWCSQKKKRVSDNFVPLLIPSKTNLIDPFRSITSFCSVPSAITVSTLWCLCPSFVAHEKMTFDNACEPVHQRQSNPHRGNMVTVRENGQPLRSPHSIIFVYRRVSHVYSYHKQSIIHCWRRHIIDIGRIKPYIAGSP